MSKAGEEKQPSPQKEQHEHMQTARNAAPTDTTSPEAAKQVLGMQPFGQDR